MATYYITSGSSYSPVQWDGESSWTAPAGWTVLDQSQFNDWLSSLPSVTSSFLRQQTDTVLQRLTETERNALFTARQSSPDIDYFITRAAAATAIRSDDPDFPAAKNALDAAGIISGSRWEELLSA